MGKRHHIVPQTYLRRFSENNKQVYAKVGRNPIRKIGIKDICVKENFYDVESCFLSKTITKDYIERIFFAENVERKLNEHLSLLQDFKEYANICSVTDKIDIARSLCIQYYRGYPFRKETSLYGNFRITLLGKLFLGKDIDFTDKVQKGHTFSIEHALETYMNEPYIFNKATFLAHGHWKILHTEFAHYITSDNPVISVQFTQDGNIYIPTKVDIGTEVSAILYPISPFDCLIICIGEAPEQDLNSAHRIFKINETDINTVKAINKLQKMNAENTIIGFCETDLE